MFPVVIRRGFRLWSLSKMACQDIPYLLLGPIQRIVVDVFSVTGGMFNVPLKSRANRFRQTLAPMTENRFESRTPAIDAGVFDHTLNFVGWIAADDGRLEKVGDSRAAT